MEYAQTGPPATEPYPLTYSVDYPDRELNRLTTFFRLVHGDPDRDRARHGLGRDHDLNWERRRKRDRDHRAASGGLPDRWRRC